MDVKRRLNVLLGEGTIVQVAAVTHTSQSYCNLLAQES